MNVLLNGENNVFDTAAQTNLMQTSIQRWYDLYQGNAPWLRENPQSLGLPAAIAAEMAKLVTLEMQININSVKQSDTAEAVSNNEANNSIQPGSSRAEYINSVLNPFRDNVRNYTEYACATGGVMFKPYFNGEGISIDCFQATDFLPLAFDNNGNITSCRFVERKVVEKNVYNRLETHKLENNVLTVTNKCFKAMSYSDKGTEVSLAEVPEWADIEPEVTINGVPRPLYEYFKIPLGNTIDPNSPLGISIYGRASTVELIHEADEQWQRFLWEFEGGELAIDAASTVFPNDKNGVPIIPAGRERLFRPNNLETGDTNELLKVFSPALRDSSIGNGLNTILKRIEFNTGLAYGTLSDPQDFDKTATEIKASKQRSYSTVSDIQKSLEKAIDGLIEAIDVTCNLYGIGGKGSYETAYKWDDSIVVDADTDRARDLNEVRQGIMQKWEFRVKWYGEDEETAKRKISEQQEQSADVFGFNLSNNNASNNNQNQNKSNDKSDDNSNDRSNDKDNKTVKNIRE